MPDPAPGAPLTTVVNLTIPPTIEVDLRPTVESAWGSPMLDLTQIRRYYANCPKDDDNAR